MKVNTKTRYGIRAMVEIAKHHDSGGIFQKDIAEKQDISNKYLDHIMQGLKVAGLIRKVSKRGGYMLTKAASTITIFDINNAFEPDICIIECLENGITCNRDGYCESKGFWSQLNQIIRSHYKSVTLEDLVQERISLDDDNSQNI